MVRELAPIVTEEWGHFRAVLQEMEKRSLSGDELKFPIIPDQAKREAQGLTLTVKEARDKKAIAILQKPDTDYVFEYRFVRGQCWRLEEVMDYSL